GGFKPNVTRVAFTPTAVAAAPLDADQFPDVVVISDSDPHITILLNDAKAPGTLGSVRTLPMPDALTRVAIGDFDMWGGNDLVVTTAFDSSVYVLFNEGTGHFPWEYKISTAPIP